MNMLNKYINLSILMHLMIGLMLILKLQSSTPAIKSGDTTVSWISSYIHEAKTEHSISENKVEAITKKEKGIVIHPKKSVTPQNENQASTSHGEQTNELLAALHAAIQKQQRYPMSAMQMERQGRATMVFTLFPDGRIENLRVLKSSGTESLDTAAFAAVSDASPFNQINKYLKSAREFTIDVVFELA